MEVSRRIATQRRGLARRLRTRSAAWPGGPYWTAPHFATTATHDGRPVLFVHNPKTAGTSLRELLGTGPTVSHELPARGITPSAWRRSYAIVAVRHPVDRVASGYLYHVRSGYDGALHRRYGDELRRLSAPEYVDFVVARGTHLLPQTSYVSYPDPHKPAADLVLRFEHVDGWTDRLAQVGVVGPGGALPERNRGAQPARTSVQDRLGLSDREMGAFKDRVLDVYRTDFEVLGYDPDDHA